ncbi:hypothetical protein Ahy_A06g027542 [Arachis hypogaea]|uniref:SWIM-type domain-containing protein n=1 Tax=Arachis hypogaea TaxID=3818 RepID=A0A445CP19_ARAHY|nr:hypothetical protein Ahy_A06g027542 [Arachis hypogaea]
MPHDKCDPDPAPPTPILIPNSPIAIAVHANTPTTRPTHDDTKSMAEHENPKLHHIPNPKPTTKPNTTPTVKQNKKPKQNQKPKRRTGFLYGLGDEAYEKFEVHEQPTNMVVDLGKRLCTCQFWMLTGCFYLNYSMAWSGLELPFVWCALGIPCVHACAALARVNRRPEDFCHPLVTMESYRKTYEHYINPLPGPSMWKKSAYSQPQAPNIKRKPGKLTTKRRKDADKGTSVNKKAKHTVTLKRQLKPFTCTYYGVKGHTKRGCKQKRADELVAALTAAAATVAAFKAKASASGSTPATESSNTVTPGPPAADIPPPVSASQAEEVELSQPNYGGTQDETPPPTTTRPPKLPTKRRTPQQPVTTSVDLMQGASAATSSRLESYHQNSQQHIFRKHSRCNSGIQRRAYLGEFPFQTIRTQDISHTHTALVLACLYSDLASLWLIALNFPLLQLHVQPSSNQQSNGYENDQGRRRRRR